MSLWRSLVSHIIDFVIPPRATERRVHNLSWDTLCALMLAPGGNSSALLPYTDERVRALVWEIKYYKNKHALALAGKSLGEALLAIAEDTIGIPVLLPVPMHRKRRRARGHNQTELLCEAALTYCKDAYTYTPHALVRVRHTLPQQGLKKERRLHNVERAMHVTNATHVQGRVCVVVDDVVTTGATLHEAKRALRAAGARKVICLALAQS